MTFWGVFLGLIPAVSYIEGPKHPLKKSYSKCFRRTEIRWVIWRLSRKGGQPRDNQPVNHLHCVSGRGRSGDRLPEGTQKPLLRPRQTPFAALALRELESACRVSIFWDAVTVPMVCFSGVLRGSPEGSAAVCDPNPSRPFARKKRNQKKALVFLGSEGMHKPYFVWLTGRLSWAQPDPHQSKKFMFMCIFQSLKITSTVLKGRN